MRRARVYAVTVTRVERDWARRCTAGWRLGLVVVALCAALAVVAQTMGRKRSWSRVTHP